MFGYFFLPSSWRSATKRTQCDVSQAHPTQTRLAKPKALASRGSLRKKRRSDMADFLITKKSKRLTNSGFLDRAFENAWFLPEDECDNDKTIDEIVSYVIKGEES